MNPFLKERNANVPVHILRFAGSDHHIVMLIFYSFFTKKLIVIVDWDNPLLLLRV